MEILDLQEESRALKQAIDSHLRIQKRHAEIIAGLEERLNTKAKQGPQSFYRCQTGERHNPV